MNNIIIPWKDELGKIAQEHYPTWHRQELQRGTNCSWEILNYINDTGKNIRLFAKKSFLKWNMQKFEEEYKLIKSRLKNIVPNQWFVWVWWHIFAFCAPIWIKVDVLSEKNRPYLIALLQKEPKLLKQFKFFVKEFELLNQEWHTLDLYGNENLVISDENKLYYLDSFLVFHDSPNIQSWSLKNLDVLKEIILEVEKLLQIDIS